jgi:hypothetical protein
MSTDYRALCSELTTTLENTWEIRPKVIQELLDRARAALAQPEPVAPTDEELEQLLFDDHRSAIEFSCDTKAEGDIVIDNHIDFARAVLARWGTPANSLPTPDTTND